MFTSVYFIPHSRISAGKTICLTLKKDVVAYFWRGKHIRRRVLLVYERHVSSPRTSRVQLTARDYLDFLSFLGNIRTSSLLSESSIMFHFLTSVYFIPHSRITEGKTICLSLKKDVVLLFLERKKCQKTCALCS